MSVKRVNSVLPFHNNSISKALLDLFPEIGLDKTKFHMINPWRDERKRRAFFENYAESKGAARPLTAESWYSLCEDKGAILSSRGAQGVIAFHKNSVTQALVDLFPDLGLDKNRLLRTKDPAHNLKHRRKFFESYAMSNGFDPLDPVAWYAQPAKKIASMKSSRSVLLYHNRSVAKALFDLFPDIGLEKGKLGLASMFC